MTPFNDATPAPRPRGCMNCRRLVAFRSADHLVCDECVTVVRFEMEQVVRDFRVLASAGVDALMPSSGAGGGGGHGGSSGTKVEAQAPLNLAVLDLMSKGGVLDSLVYWVDRWNEDLGFEPSRGEGSPVDRLESARATLVNHLPWARETLAADLAGFISDVRVLVKQLATAIDPAVRTRVTVIGKCPSVGPGGGEPCNKTVVVRDLGPASATAHCSSCGRVFNRTEWLLIKDHTDQLAARPRLGLKRQGPARY